MATASYELGGRRVGQDIDDNWLQRLLADHYLNFKGKPPLCLCTDIHVRMYIAKVGERFLLKRWPGSGHEHAPDCDRYEPPLEASGLGRLLGTAIREDMSTGDVELKLGFPLRKQARTSAAAEIAEVEGQEAEQPEDAGGSSSKASLRAVLHYLWDQAELTHWKPGMKGKRNWWVVQSRLQDAAAQMTARGQRLNRRLFIPEAFKPELKEPLRLKRRALFQSVASQKASRDLLMFLIEVKELSPSTYGYKLIAKNVPDETFFLSGELYKALRKRFMTEIEMFEQADGQGHLVAFGTMSVKPSGLISVEEMTLMSTTAEWIPIKDGQEAVVVNYSVASGRHFIKPLRYNMGGGRALASVVFTDAPSATALYIVSPADCEAAVLARREIQNSGATQWVEWRIAENFLPSDIIDSILVRT